jgi:hypothetical protein
MVKVDLVCYILGKGVPFVPVAMQHGATENVLLRALCATRRCDRRRASVRAVRDKEVRQKTCFCGRGARCARQGGANITSVFTTDRERLPCGKMVRIFKSVFVLGLQYLLRTLCFQIYLRYAYGNSGTIYPGSPLSLMVLLV